MRRSIVIAALLAAASAGGCIPSEKLAEGELDRWWYLQQDVWSQAEPLPLSISDRKLPSRWIFRRETSLIWSTVSIVRAADLLQQGPKEIEVLVHPAHAEMLGDVLAEVRRAILDLKAVADPKHPPTPQRWAATIAHALTLAEHVARVSAPTDRPADARREERLGWSAGPMLEMALAYLNERSGGSLLAGAEEAGRLRSVLAQVILRMGLAVVGKQDSPELRREVTSRMAGVERLEDLQASLQKALGEAYDRAPPSAGPDAVAAALRTVFAFAPRMFEVLESFARQWPNTESLEIEFRRWRGQPLVATKLTAAGRREVRIEGMFFMQPVLVFRGSSRMVVLPKVPGTGETAVLFEPIDGGATEIRFEGLGYALASLVAVPLASGPLREVRVAAGGPDGGPHMVNVAMLMEASGRRGDPRRLIVFQDVRRVRRAREAFEVRTETLREDQTFHYLTPDRRYTYHRRKGLEER